MEQAQQSTGQPWQSKTGEPGIVVRVVSWAAKQSLSMRQSLLLLCCLHLRVASMH